MRLVLLLLVLVPLAMGSGCPAMLEGLDFNNTFARCTSPAKAGSAAALSIKEYSIEDAVDVSCGRSNFTTAFWSNLFVQEIILYVVTIELDKNGTMDQFKPLSESIKAQYAALKDEKAKAYVDAFLKHQRKSRRRRMTAARLMKEVMALMGLNFAHILPIDSQIALAQATKKAFGVVETDEMKQARIDTAMSAIERLGVFSYNERMAELFPGLYELATTNFTMGKSAFEGFANDLDNAWVNSTTISHMEVVPAVETLYLQYRTLNNTEAKEFVDLFLASMVMSNSDYTPVKDDDRDRSQYTKAVEVVKAGSKICHRWNLYPITKRNQLCFKALPEETKEKIRTTFPEIFVYLNSKFSMDNWANGITEKTSKKDSIAEIEGSGQF